MKHKSLFQFNSYRISRNRKEILFSFTIQSGREQYDLTERIILPTRIPANVPSPLLKSILESIHLVLGLSYYKSYVPKTIVHPYRLTTEQAEYWNAVYRNGLGEFCYRNKIDPKLLARFHGSDIAHHPTRFVRQRRALIGIGGGKDSVVAVEHLRKMGWKPTAFHLETSRSPLIEKVIQVLGLSDLTIKRRLDPKLLAGLPGTYNGHVPISAIYCWVGILGALIQDYRYVLVGNEASSNTGNVRWKGHDINHQWSKSGEFESLTQTYLKKWVTPDIEYVSVLRPFTELRVLQDFAKHPKYFPAFSSCNRNFQIIGQRPINGWCGECPKCAFVFLGLAAFLPKAKVVRIFGQNLLNKPSLVKMYQGLLGLGGMKPFECVGTFEENRVALTLAAKKFAGSLVINTFARRAKATPVLMNQVLSVQNGPVSALPFQLLGMRSALIVGYAREGKATHAYLRKSYPWIKVGIADQSQGKNYLAKQLDYDVSIKTPGIAMRFMSGPYTTATNLFFGQVENTIIGVTGTKGKSTTASLIYHILKTADRKTELLGNIGKPMLGRLAHPIDPKIIFVFEMSSYQLEDILAAPHVAVIINLYPEHLDYHQSFENYAAAKYKIAQLQKPGDIFVYNPAFPALKKLSHATAGRAVPFVQRIPRYETRLAGKHNQDNIRAAVTVAKQFKISDAAIQKALKTFKPLPHRLQVVRTYQGITFVDDAISTTPESTIAALQTFRNTQTIFLGGTDRGYDFSKLQRALKKSRVRNIVLFPDSGFRIQASKSRFKVLKTRQMKAAVAFAYRNTSPGSVCLLSCASPSYSLWKNFEAKGLEFQKWVKKLA